ncbi:uncharacterized protein BO87DRAFT_189080 [Aspergillus neoniger CBS 115656]|uniref:Uncharacterized protein n=1 Tax=Aspergillus neoniger (strain CBS 115656) TaxID=1448310 RepID=A0A318YUD4_ASPNB|nr:hypothetical protein BO87DRAFT_189080 [Aspergillus neoniger CBS 115656]PYH37914.1 hypothetical protein BO87DRAFT_189080 [Aspergillus neoniger CBS 115656]
MQGSVTICAFSSHITQSLVASLLPTSYSVFKSFSLLFFLKGQYSDFVDATTQEETTQVPKGKWPSTLALLPPGEVVSYQPSKTAHTYHHHHPSNNPNTSPAGVAYLPHRCQYRGHPLNRSIHGTRGVAIAHIHRPQN